MAQGSFCVLCRAYVEARGGSRGCTRSFAIFLFSRRFRRQLAAPPFFGRLRQADAVHRRHAVIPAVDNRLPDRRKESQLSALVTAGCRFGCSPAMSTFARMGVACTQHMTRRARGVECCGWTCKQRQSLISLHCFFPQLIVFWRAGQNVRRLPQTNRALIKMQTHFFADALASTAAPNMNLPRVWSRNSLVVPSTMLCAGVLVSRTAPHILLWMG